MVSSLLKKGEDCVHRLASRTNLRWPLKNILMQPTKAFLIGLAICVSLVEFVKFTASRGLLSSADARKLLHILIGPVFLLIWPMFDTPTAQSPSHLWAAAIPGIVTLVFTLVGAGVVKDKATVKMMSRSGDAGELLGGPLQVWDFYLFFFFQDKCKKLKIKNAHI
jgi:hypothetical protein